MKKLLEVLQSGADYLAGKGVEHSRLVMEQLMSHVLQCPRLQLYLRFETMIPEDRLVGLREGIKRLGAGVPLQYVVGNTEFMGHRFKTDPRALIPRPDTETLVNAVLACDSLWATGRPAIAEIGVGSGCVVISLALARPEVNYVAVDVSEAALALAGENAESNRVGSAIAFKRGDLLTGFESGSLQAVVANLPYIPSADCGELSRHIREHEPMSALDGGTDGLDLIRKLIQQATGVLCPGGRIFLEIGFDQAVRVVDTLRGCGFVEMVVHRDLGGRDRVVQATR
jgi:release factor glutamine methyltransferase